MRPEAKLQRRSDRILPGLSGKPRGIQVACRLSQPLEGGRRESHQTPTPNNQPSVKVGWAQCLTRGAHGPNVRSLGRFEPLPGHRHTLSQTINIKVRRGTYQPRSH